MTETDAAEEVDLSAREERSHMWISTPLAQTPNSRSRPTGSLSLPEDSTTQNDAPAGVGDTGGASSSDLSGSPEPCVVKAAGMSSAQIAIPDTTREITASSAPHSDSQSLTRILSFEGPSGEVARTLHLNVERMGSTVEATENGAMAAPFGKAQQTGAASGAKVTDSVHSRCAFEDGMGR